MTAPVTLHRIYIEASRLYKVNGYYYLTIRSRALNFYAVIVDEGEVKSGRIEIESEYRI